MGNKYRVTGKEVLVRDLIINTRIESDHFKWTIVRGRKELVRDFIIISSIESGHSRDEIITESMEKEGE